jgi:HPt (histidine-containing phosphotransfer) domain-containing protein
MDEKMYNLKKLNEIAQGDHGFVQEMLVTFVENVTTDIGNIQSLKLAENWTVIAETAHKLASNFAYLGATSLQILAGDIEKRVLNDQNLTGIAEKTEKLCYQGSLLINQVKKDFAFMITN